VLVPVHRKDAGTGVALVDYVEDPHSGVTYAPDRPPSTRNVCAVT
jgi:hypothetical protein